MTAEQARAQRSAEGQTRGRRRPTREQTRAKILAAAEQVFAEHGIDAASVDHVAAAAGLTKGAVYSSFRSKSELVSALMSEHLTQRQVAAERAIDTAADAGDALRDAGAVLVRATRTDATWQRLLISYAVHNSGDPAVREALRERRRQLRDTMAALIERIAEQHGLVLPFSAQEAAFLVLALVNGFAVEGGLDPDAVPEDLFGRVLAVLAGAPD